MRRFSRFSSVPAAGSLALLVALAAACHSSDRIAGLSAEPDLVLQVDPSLNLKRLPQDAARIEAASVTDDVLTLTLTYGGGCREHRLGMVTGTDLGSSNPPYTLLRLVHDAGGDACEALIRRTVTVRLDPLADLLRGAGIRAVRFELVEPGERRSGVGELLYEF